MGIYFLMSVRNFYLFILSTIYLSALFFDSCFVWMHLCKSPALPGLNLSLDGRSAFSLFPSSQACCSLPFLSVRCDHATSLDIFIILLSCFSYFLPFFFLCVTHHPTEGHRHTLQIFSPSSVSVPAFYSSQWSFSRDFRITPLLRLYFSPSAWHTGPVQLLWT